MNILFEIADKDLMLIGLGVLCLIIFAVVIFYIIGKNDRVKPIEEHERFDNYDFAKTEEKVLTDEQKQAKAELEKVYSRISADLEDKQVEPEVIEQFEREQEENAVISYQELIEKSKDKEVPVDVIKATIGFKEELATNPIEVIPEVVKKEKPKTEDEPKKFKNSEIISPIFGVQNNENKKPTKTKQIYEEIKVAEENDSNVDFLNSLKEFRKNL